MLTQKKWDGTRLAKNPLAINVNTFGKVFQKRLDDQYEQIWSENIRNSPRFDILACNKSGYKMSKYLEQKTIQRKEMSPTDSELT